MTPTVDDLRNEIRETVGRYERVESTAFTKEALRDICEAVGHEVDAAGRLPPKAEMRAAILRELGKDDSDADRPFRKAELEAVATTLREDRSE